MIARVYIRPPLWKVTKVDLPGFWNCFWPLVLFSISIAVFNKLDLLLLKMLGGTTDQAGIYAAGQALAVVPSIFAMSFSPLLLSTVSSMISSGDLNGAKKISLQAMRVIVVLLPFAAMTAGMSQELVDLVFGPLFRPAAANLSLLIFGALAMAMVSVVTAILTAAGKPNSALVQAAILVPVAAAGHLLFIPRFGLIGAAAVTTCCAIFGALGSVLAVYRMWHVFPPIRTLLRACIVCAVAFALASGWPTLHSLVVLKIFAIGSIIGVLFFLFGEFGTTEIDLVRSLAPWKITGKA
jgi:O-antigen/teichoic acid export membrane protein